MIFVVWLLIALILLTILVNIRSFMVMAHFQKERKQLAEDTAALHQSMEEFVGTIELENDELYSKLADTIKENENRLKDRIRRLEERKESAPASELAVKAETLEIAATEPEEELQGTAKIEQLHKQGFSVQQIAKVVEEERGEIELIINMYRKKQSYQK